MNNEEIKQYLIDFQKSSLPELIERELEIDNTKKIKTIIGPRRAGKTYFLFQKIHELISSGVKKEAILYLNFENPKLIDINFKEIKEIIKIHWQLYPVSIEQTLHIFIDEPQNIKNWEVAVRSLSDEGFDIFLTGSSSKLLSKEIATSLRGRTLSYILLPFSFGEFLKIKNVILDVDRLSSKEKSALLGMLSEYIEIGGFPEVAAEKNAGTKIKILNEYFELVVYRDIVDRYKIKNTGLVKWLIKSLMTSVSSEFSVHKIYQTLKSKGIKASKNTLYSYLSILEDSLFMFFVPKFTDSIRKKEFSINKVYLCDVGFTKLIDAALHEGKKMENAVFLELKRKEKEIYYWKNQQQEEVDFVIKEKGRAKHLIQVCYDPSDLDTKKRETRALIKASKELKCSNLFIITWDIEKEEKIDGKKIKYVPLWKWLLEK